MRRKLTDASWAFYSKLTGLFRDLLIVFYLGLTESSDALFLGMTFIMFFQLVSYKGNINALGKINTAKKLCDVIAQHHRSFTIGSATYVLALIPVFHHIQAIEVQLFIKTGIIFFLLSPFAIVLGLLASFGVLYGNSKAQVIIISIQNTALIASFVSINLMGFDKYSFLAWGISFVAVLLFLPMAYHVENDEVTTETIRRKGDESLLYEFASPSLMFAIVFAERFFYANVEGSLGLIKLLETGAMSVIFLIEVLFVNSILTKLRQGLGDAKKVYSELSNSIRKALFFGMGIMSTAIIIIIILYKNGFLPLKIPSSLDKYFVVLCVTYIVYFSLALSRDYLERFLFAVGSPKIILRLNILALFTTITLNWLFMKYAPLSIIAISVTLLSIRVLFLMWGTNKVLSDSS